MLIGESHEHVDKSNKDTCTFGIVNENGNEFEIWLLESPFDASLGMGIETCETWIRDPNPYGIDYGSCEPQRIGNK